MILVVEKGHCYRTTGATGTTGEQDYATAVADAIYKYIHGRAGWTVKRKLADSNDYSGHAFVAIHCDGSTNNTARGASIGYQNSQGQQFGQVTMRAYAARGWTGGFRPDNYTDALKNYYGVRESIQANNTKAFIMECGFMTNSGDRDLMTGPGGVDRVALSIADALGIQVEEPMSEPTEIDYQTAVRLRDFNKGLGRVDPADVTAQNVHVAGELVAPNLKLYELQQFMRSALTMNVAPDLDLDFSEPNGPAQMPLIAAGDEIPLVTHLQDMAAAVQQLQDSIAQLNTKVDQLIDRETMNTDTIRQAAHDGTVEALETNTVSVAVTVQGDTTE